MTSQQLSKFIINPLLVSDQGIMLLDDLVTRFPYCQSGHLLLACSLSLEESSRYPDQLKKAAAYAGDRRILKELIGRTKKAGLAPEPESRIPAWHAVRPAPQTELQTIEIAPVSYERMTQEELLAIVKKRLAEIAAEKKLEQALTDDYDSQPPKSEITSSKASLIEKFIQDEPRISKPKTTFFNPTDSAIRSNFDDEEIVSETLAQLYAQVFH
jgi:hypothetical protein